MRKKDKRLQTYFDNTVKCKCGASLFMPAFLDYRICSWCKNRVYRNEKIKFEYEMKARLKKCSLKK